MQEKSLHGVGISNIEQKIYIANEKSNKFANNTPPYRRSLEIAQVQDWDAQLSVCTDLTTQKVFTQNPSVLTQVAVYFWKLFADTEIGGIDLHGLCEKLKAMKSPVTE
ncbi:hypothetical protein HA402_002625 [Bradysia odoriphaga]|nr:hypothetical protein HA402_002625 [Bradysia odoriphaga]